VELKPTQRGLWWDTGRVGRKPLWGGAAVRGDRAGDLGRDRAL